MHFFLPRVLKVALQQTTSRYVENLQAIVFEENTKTLFHFISTTTSNGTNQTSTQSTFTLHNYYYIKMFIKTIFSFLLLVVALCAAQDATQDIQVGLQGLMEAAKDPALLAQLVRDMQVRIRHRTVDSCNLWRIFPTLLSAFIGLSVWRVCVIGIIFRLTKCNRKRKTWQLYCTIALKFPDFSPCHSCYIRAIWEI